MKNIFTNNVFQEQAVSPHPACMGAGLRRGATRGRHSAIHAAACNDIPVNTETVDEQQ